MWKEKRCGIYCIENKITHKKYIGQSVYIDYRWTTHRSELRNHTHNNDYLQKSWDKYGEDAFDFYVLELCSKEDLDKREIYYINLYNTLDRDKGFNLKDGGQSGKLSEESINKKSQTLKEIYNTTDLRERKRQSALKQWSDPKIKAKICGENNGMYGKTHSQEARDKISKAAMGRKSSRRNLSPVLCVELNRIFECAAEAEKEFDMRLQILEVCKGNRKTTGGYHWKFAMENNI